jgi:dipeptidyl aminopeptidase/acylaminoacyl peptidase
VEEFPPAVNFRSSEDHLRRTLLLLLLGVSTISLSAKENRPLQLSDMFAIKRISSPSLSPDGAWIAFTVTVPDLPENRTVSDIWLVSSDGMNLRQLTFHPANDRNPVWSPDGTMIAFESNQSGSYQVWILPIQGGEPRQFTRISSGASQATWSPDGKLIAFISEVFPEYSHMPFRESDSLNQARNRELDQGKVRAKLITGLLYRHWDHWVDGKRKHLFVQPTEGGDPLNLTPGTRDAVPTSTTFSSGIDYAFSPDSKEIAYTATTANTQEEAWTTNHDILAVPVTGGEPRQITTNPAADGYPRYSPDGTYIAYRSQTIPGFEADRWRLMLYDRATGDIRSLTRNFDSSVESPTWHPSGTMLCFSAEEQGKKPMFTISISDDNVRKIFSTSVSTSPTVSPDGSRIYFTNTSFTRPAELFSIGSNGENLIQVTNLNRALFAGLSIPPPESVWFEGEGGLRVHAWIFKPDNMSAGKKYPFVYLVHGGPQNAWLDAWSFRWNPALWAAQGYVVMAPNPRGSTGFGQEFVNEISNDWGGKVFVDLMRGLDYAEQLPFVDKDNKAAAGASYGGYMMNWFQAKAGGRFKTLVTHCGTYNLVSKYGTTEEIWFNEWDHGGTPWDNPDGYAKYSPHTYAGNFNTPNLIIHNELDYRVPLSEGMQLFTTLQRRGVPSKMLYFPDEGHWVLKPANSELWHKTVFDWLAQYLKAGDANQ